MTEQPVYHSEDLKENTVFPLCRVEMTVGEDGNPHLAIQPIAAPPELMLEFHNRFPKLSYNLRIEFKQFLDEIYAYHKIALDRAEGSRNVLGDAVVRAITAMRGGYTGPGETEARQVTPVEIDAMLFEALQNSGAQIELVDTNEIVIEDEMGFHCEACGKPIEWVDEYGWFHYTVPDADHPAAGPIAMAGEGS